MTDEDLREMKQAVIDFLLMFRRESTDTGVAVYAHSIIAEVEAGRCDRDTIPVPRELLERLANRLPYAQGAAILRGAPRDVIDAMIDDEETARGLLARTKETTTDET